jgi:hypothetical protein
VFDLHNIFRFSFCCSGKKCWICIIISVEVLVVVGGKKKCWDLPSLISVQACLLLLFVCKESWEIVLQILQVNLLASWVVGCQHMETNNRTAMED